MKKELEKIFGVGRVSDLDGLSVQLIYHLDFDTMVKVNKFSKKNNLDYEIKPASGSVFIEFKTV